MENQITVEQKAQIENILVAHTQVLACNAVSEDNGRKSIEAAITAGKSLKEIKGDVGHGKFTAWLDKHLKDISAETARRYMRLAQANPKKLANCTSLRQAYLAVKVISTSAPRKARTTGTASANTGTMPNGATQAATGTTGNASTTTPSPAAPVADKPALSELVEMVMSHLSYLKDEGEIKAATEAIAPCGLWYIQRRGRLAEIAVLPIAA